MDDCENQTACNDGGGGGALEASRSPSGKWGPKRMATVDMFPAEHKSCAI